MAEKTQAIQKTDPQPVQGTALAERAPTEWTYCPAVDILDTESEYLLIADVPGANRDDIDVSFQEDILTIQAPVVSRGARTAQFHRQEYGVGGFHRRFVVEAPVDADRLAASYENGVLTVRMPKAEKAKGRRIPVKGGK